MNNINNLHKTVIDSDKLRELRGSVHRDVVGEAIGVGGSQIANIEQGIRKPSANKLLRLMLFYNVKPADIVKTEENAIK